MVKRRKLKASKAKTSKKVKSKFAGVDDVYLTKKSIAVRKVSSKRLSNGDIVISDNTKYLPRSTVNMNALKREVGYVPFGRKG